MANKFVNIYNGKTLERVVKIDSNDEPILKAKETDLFKITGGLIGQLDRVNNCVKVIVPQIWVIEKGDKQTRKELLNKGVDIDYIFEIKGQALKDLKDNGIAKDVKFTDIKGVSFTIIKTENGLKVENDFESQTLPYYTEDNFNFLDK